METIYIVEIDWAFNGGCESMLLKCFREERDAVAYMEQYWQEELDMDYLNVFDSMDMDYLSRRAWTEGNYDDQHSCVWVRPIYLFSHEDVIAGLAI